MTLFVSKSQHLTICAGCSVRAEAAHHRCQWTYLVLAAREEVGMPRRDGEAAHGRDVTRERELELARRQVPDLQMICQHHSVQIAGIQQEVPGGQPRTLITRSPAPVANHLLPGSTAAARTQPKWPEMTRTSFQGA